MAALPGLLAVAVFVAWATQQGGYFQTASLPGTIFLLGVLVATVLAGPTRVGRSASVALAALAAFMLWSFASMAWADVPSEAWQASNRIALYLVVFALFAVARWTPVAAAAVLGLFSLGVAGVGIYALTDAAASSEPASFFISGRFSAPLGYQNANAALFLLAFWPALFLASRRELPAIARGFLLATAGALVELAVLPQSRGAVVAFVVASVAYVALVPGRLRALLHAVPVAVAVLAAWPSLAAVYGSAETGRFAASLDEARTAVLFSLAALAIVGTALALLDGRVPVPARLHRAAGRILLAAAALLAVAGLVAAVATDPIGRLDRAWHDFTTVRFQPEALEGSTRLGAGVASNRYDMWRVALGALADRPLTGIGAQNYAFRYLRERRSDEDARYPHSLEFQHLAETGLVGAALFALFVVAGLAAAWRTARTTEPFTSGVAVVGVVAFGYWLVHASVDWLWEFPAVTAPALAWLGLAAGFGRAASPLDASRGGRRLRLATVAAAPLLAVSLLLPWLSAREVERAEAAWRSDPAAAFDALGRAESLNRLDDRASVLAALIASRRGEWARMRAASLRALNRNPVAWYAHLELALAEAQLGRLDAARSSAVAAARLNPRSPLVALVRERLDEGVAVRPQEIHRLALERYLARGR
ncbi:MAG TPA: O-antigen ligase family protein [Gaiellaceae bacterium]|nr:O-antigen ligase family protein [Gaiellaceae bacterium]